MVQSRASIPSKVHDVDRDRVHADNAERLNAMATSDQLVAAGALDDGRRRLQADRPDRCDEGADVRCVIRPGVVGEIDLIERHVDNAGRSEEVADHA
jgi:hypothetical protein